MLSMSAIWVYHESQVYLKISHSHLDEAFVERESEILVYLDQASLSIFFTDRSLLDIETQCVFNWFLKISKFTFSTRLSNFLRFLSSDLDLCEMLLNSCLLYLPRQFLRHMRSLIDFLSDKLIVITTPSLKSVTASIYWSLAHHTSRLGNVFLKFF